MGQVTWRVEDELLARVRAVAERQGMSVNGFLTEVMAAATDPELARTDIVWIQERLARAGLLAPPAPPRARPDEAEFQAARRAAGRGGPLASEIVSTDRG